MLTTVWNTQRGSQRYYTEKRRGRREIEVTRRRRGGVKRGETNLAIISSLSVLHSPELPERFTELSREEKMRNEIEVTWGRKGRVRRGERNQASNHTPKRKWILQIRFL